VAGLVTGGSGRGIVRQSFTASAGTYGGLQISGEHSAEVEDQRGQHAGHPVTFPNGNPWSA